MRYDNRVQYLSAVCMGCLEGWTLRLRCRSCGQPWDGSHLILGTMYTFDIFAATPCCAERLKVRCRGMTGGGGVVTVGRVCDECWTFVTVGRVWDIVTVVGCVTGV